MVTTWRPEKLRATLLHLWLIYIYIYQLKALSFCPFFAWGNCHSGESSSKEGLQKCMKVPFSNIAELLEVETPKEIADPQGGRVWATWETNEAPIDDKSHQLKALSFCPFFAWGNCHSGESSSKEGLQKCMKVPFSNIAELLEVETPKEIASHFFRPFIPWQVCLLIGSAECTKLQKVFSQKYRQWLSDGVQGRHRLTAKPSVWLLGPHVSKTEAMKPPARIFPSSSYLPIGHVSGANPHLLSLE